MSAFANIARRYIAPVAGARSDRLRLLFDIEGVTTVLCIVIVDLDSGQVSEYGPDQIPAALEHLARADDLIGHNIVGYDLPLLERLHGWRPKPGCTIIDTLVAGRLILPNISDLDDQAAAMGDPKLGKLRGSYKLEAWGIRLGIPKVGADITDFSVWTPELQARCVGDVALTKALWHFLQPDGYSQQALELEHRVAPLCDRITKDGVPFDRAAAEQLREQWERKRAELRAKLQEQFPGTNINSRPQLGALLEARGWIPEKRTEKTKQPVINDEVFETIPALFPEFTGLAEYELLRRRLAQLATGQQAWLKHIGDDGRIHGALIHIGTPHSRAKHLTPNIAQVPNAKKGGAYAAECRALFRHPGDWVFLTCDQANLQDRAFAHHLTEFDGGAYGQAFLAGLDQHWQNAMALELVPAGTERDKESKVHTAIREGAKTFRYGNLFGAGAARCTEILTETVRAVQHIDPTYTAPTDGKRARARFIAATPGLAPLQTKLETQVARSQWLPGLDGRRVPTRAQYTALNYALASIEAIVCKRWLVNVYDELCARFKYGWSGDAVIVLWVHDEIAVCCRPEIAEPVGEILTRHAKEAGEYYGLRVPLDGEYKIGRSWAGEPVTPIAEPMVPETVSTDTGGETEIIPAAVADLESDVAAAGDDDGLEDFANADDTEDDGDRQLGHVGGIDVARDGGHHDHGETDQADALTTMTGVGLVAPIVDFAPAASARPSLRTGNGSSAGGSKIRCPFHDGDDTASLHVYNDEADPHYHCFGCGAHGPLSDLPEELAATPVAQTQADDVETLAYAHRLWEQAQSIAGTLAERYLSETRGIDITALPPSINEVLRFHAQCPFDGRRPCLLALFRDVATDEPAGIHRVALTPEARKIERRMLGRWPRPRAIKLWPLIKVEAAPKPLYLGEGIETVLAAATRLKNHGRPMWPAWAAGSSGNVEKFPIITDVEELTLLVDHGMAGEKAAAICRQTWKAAGRQVRRLWTQDPSLNDFNDLVRAKLRGVS